MAMNPRLLRPVAAGVHPEAAAWKNAVVTNGGTVSGSTLNAVNKFCRSIDAAGIRDRFYRLNLFCGTGLSACLVPLYRAESSTATARGNTTDTNANFVSGDYVETGSGGGLAGNGSTKYLNTGVAANAVAFSDRHLCVYEIARTTATFDIAIGARSSSPTTYFEITSFSAATTYSFRSSDTVTSANDSGYTAAGAMMLGVHPTSNTGVLYRNGVSAATASFSSRLNTYNGAIFVFAGNSDGSAVDHSSSRIGAYSIGLAFTDSQALAYYNALQAFETALSRSV